MSTRATTIALIALGAVISTASTAPTQNADYPNRPITFIVPCAAGASIADQTACLIAKTMSAKLGQPIVVAAALSGEVWVGAEELGC